MIIENGWGNSGAKAQVDDEGRLHTHSTSVASDRHRNQEGYVWSCTATNTTTGTDDFFFLLKNNGTEDLAITDIRAKSDVVTELTYEVVSGEPIYTADTDVTPIARNLGTNKVPSAIIKSDSDITGITSGGEIFFQQCDTVDKLYHLRASSNIIIPQGQTMAIKSSAAATVKCLVSLVQLETE